MKNFLAALIIALILFPVAFAQNNDIPKPHLITVNGDAEVKVTPDKAIITAGIETVDKDIIAAKKQNDDIVKRLVENCVKLGIPEGNISTDFINVDNKYERVNDQQKFVGYYMRRRVAITLTDITKFDILVTELLSSGIYQIKDVKFETTELRKYKDQARADAIRAAREKAQAMTNELGQTIGKAYSIDEKSSFSRSWYGGWNNWYGGANYPNPFNASSNAPSPTDNINPDMPLALGKISVTASVSVSFELQ